jgi:hypothetical protein
MFSVLLPLGMGLFHWKRLGSPLRLVVWIAGLSIVSDITSLVLMYLHLNTWPVGNLFFIAQFILFFFALNPEKKTTLLWYLFSGCLIFALVNFFFVQTPTVFNSSSAYLCGVLTIITAIYILYGLLRDRPVERVHILPLFWIAFGALIYHAGTQLVFLFNNYLIAHQPENHQSIWVLHNMLNIIKNVFLFIAVWMSYKARISQR